MKKIVFVFCIAFFNLVFSPKLIAQNAEQLIDSALSFYQAKAYEKSYLAFSKAFEKNETTENQTFNFYCFSVAAEECGKTAVSEQYLEKALRAGILRSFKEIDYVKGTHPLYKKKVQTKVIDSLINWRYRDLRAVVEKDSTYFLHLQDTSLKINSNANAQLFLKKLQTAKISTISLLDSLTQFHNFPIPPKINYFVLYYFSGKTEKIPYVLFIPKNYNPQKKHALCVYLHGGTATTENFNFTEAYAEKEPIFKWAKGTNTFVLYPLGKKSLGWHEGEDAIKNVYDMIKNIQQLYNIDEGEITFTGMSNGARGVVYTALNYPKRFKHFLAISASSDIYQDTLLLNNLTNSYTLNLMQGTEDELYSYAEHQRFFNKVQDKNFKLTMTSFDKGGHGFIYTDSGYVYFCEQLNKIISSPGTHRVVDTINWTFDSSKNSECQWLKTTPSSIASGLCTIQIGKKGNNYFITHKSKSTDKINIVIELYYKQIDLTKPICIYNETNKKIFERKITPLKETSIRAFQENFDRKNVLIDEIVLTL